MSWEISGTLLGVVLPTFGAKYFRAISSQLLLHFPFFFREIHLTVLFKFNMSFEKISHSKIVYQVMRDGHTKIS